MRRAITATAAALVLVVAGFVNVAGGEGRGYAEGAFQSVATGGFNVAVGTAAGAASVRIPAAEKSLSVLIFPYAGGPSEARTFCGDAWNVLVSVAFGFREDKPGFPLQSADHYLDGQPVGAKEKTRVTSSETVLGERGVAQGFGTFVAPGTLSNGTHQASQVVKFDGQVVWAPPPLTFSVSDSAC